MNSNSPHKRDYMLRQAAYLHSLGLSNVEVAELLGRDSGQMTKDLRAAEKKGYLQFTAAKYIVHDDLSAISLEEFFSSHPITTELITKLKHWEKTGLPSGAPFTRPNVLVLSSRKDLNEGLAGPVIPFDNDWNAHPDYDGWDLKPNLSDAATCYFTNLAAESVLSTLASCSSVGCTWGRTLNALLDLTPQKRTDLTNRRGQGSPVNVYPLWGEAWKFNRASTDSVKFPDRETLSSTYLARCLSRLLNNGDELHARSLHAAPALIPLKLLKHAKIIKEFLATQSAFDEIFGPNGAVNQLDAILATVGVPDCHYRFWSDELLDSLKLTAADFGRMVLGDVGGVLIAKPGINDEQQALLKKIQGCWLGVRMEHLQRCCRVGKPGVIVLAIGPMRAKVVLYTLLHRLVNHLIVDRSLARTLIRLMDDVERVGALAALK